MATITPYRGSQAIGAQGKPYVPPLQNGDRLTRAEFERRYDAMPESIKAELIEGEVHIPSPVRIDQHGEPHQDINLFLGLYKKLTPGVRGADAATVRLDEENEPLPDSFLFVPEAQAFVDEENYVCGSPELISEVTASSVSIDLGRKFRVYERNKVKEYVVWRVEDQEIDWFILRGEKFERLPPHDNIYKSEVFPGLWLDPAALIRDDFARLYEVLQQGIASPEYQAFVARLQQEKPDQG